MASLIEELKTKTTEELCAFLREQDISDDVIEKFESEGICGEVLPLSLTELMELAPRIGPRRILQKRIPQLLGYVNAELDDASMHPIKSNSYTDSTSTSSKQASSSMASASSSAQSAEDEVASQESPGKSSDETVMLDDSDICGTLKLVYPCELPRFSKVVLRALRNGDVYKEWDLFVREAAIFYLPDMPSSDGLARIAYHNIGRSMFEKYPCIKSAGQNAWSHFNKCLSSKIRWERQKRQKVQKRKASSTSVSTMSKRNAPATATCPQGSPPTPETPATASPAPAIPSVEVPFSEPISEEVYSAHVAEIQRVFNNCQKKDGACTSSMNAHMNKLLRETFPKRRQIINSPEPMNTLQLVDQLWTDFPCLKFETFFLEEIRGMNLNLETYYNLHYSEVLGHLGDLYGIPHDTDYDQFLIWQETENRLNKRGKNLKLIKGVEMHTQGQTKKGKGTGVFFIFEEGFL
ncbi:uncharacterized protein LOC110977977 [Acanthaster planci]|uniref:Uncharacterized protein LOC110977977 n=1 Tax=Acanthaster planci TaxID=133434 RepID=A0A8B7Y937_ACAPL|nr:uncharacterized protein LOC110977977 [Acanthaster planci]